MASRTIVSTDSTPTPPTTAHARPFYATALQATLGEGCVDFEFVGGAGKTPLRLSDNGETRLYGELVLETGAIRSLDTFGLTSYGDGLVSFRWGKGAGDEFASVSATGEITANGGFLTDSILERTADEGVTVEGVILKDSTVYTDTVAESTSGAGVTVDGVLLKDGGATLKDSTQFVDNAVGNRKMRFDASNIGEGETRVLKMADADVDLEELLGEHLDGEVGIPFFTGAEDGGTWSRGFDGTGLVKLSRAAASGDDSYWVSIPLPNRVDSDMGFKPLAVVASYRVVTGDVLDVRFEVHKVTLGTNSADRTSEEWFGASSGTCTWDEDHETGEERGEAKYHLITVTNDDPSVLGTGDTLLLRIYCDGGTEGGVLHVTSVILQYSLLRLSY